MVPAGTYRARGVQATLCETKSGNEQVAIEFAILDVDGTEGEHVTYFGGFTEKGFPITVKALRACGWKGSDVSDLSGVDANEVSLVLEDEEFEGKWRTKVKWVNEPSRGVAVKAPLEGARAKAFAQSMKAKILAMEGGAPRPQSGPSQSGARPAPSRTSAYGAQRRGPPEPPPINEDPNFMGDGDIPF